jgi:hypothetical protein
MVEIDISVALNARNITFLNTSDITVQTERWREYRQRQQAEVKASSFRCVVLLKV